MAEELRLEFVEIIVGEQDEGCWLFKIYILGIIPKKNISVSKDQFGSAFLHPNGSSLGPKAILVSSSPFGTLPKSSYFKC